MVNKVRVYGKAQNRTALGIVQAYLVMYPQSTIEDLRKAFPNELAPDKGIKENFIYAEEKGTVGDFKGYFQKPDELLTCGDGRQVAFAMMWTKPSFERLVAHAAQYGIEIAQFEAADKGGVKGGYRLEYLNGYVPPQPAKKGLPKWAWAAIGAGALAAAGLGIKLSIKPEVETEVQVKTVVVRDTVYVQQVEEIQDKFNAAQFDQNSAELKEEAKFALHDLAGVMKKNPDLKLSIEGHTSSEGDAAANQALSEKRAQAAVDFLVNTEGIDASRLQAVGKGSSEPLDPNNLEANRRTEFEIIK